MIQWHEIDSKVVVRMVGRKGDESLVSLLVGTGLRGENASCGV
jgi:hypothetical protein